MITEAKSTRARHAGPTQKLCQSQISDSVDTTFPAKLATAGGRFQTLHPSLDSHCSATE